MKATVQAAAVTPCALVWDNKHRVEHQEKSFLLISSVKLGVA
jgi:hypothetical protein